VGDEIVYVTYDGATEPLGRSQVLAYLERLASDFSVTLLSFEKREPTAGEREEVASMGIRWRPLRYHRRPPVASTALDVALGVRALSRALSGRNRVVVHARSYVPAEIVLRCPAARRARFLFDIRGLWVDERLEAGIWRPGPLARYARRRERRFFERADAVVTLTHASVPVLEERADGPVEVIPTCADVGRYASTRPRAEGPALAWVGSIGTWYRFDLALRAARVSGLPLHVLTRQRAEAGREAEDATVASVPHERLHEKLHAGDVGLCLYKAGFSRVACAPTRFAEYLAAGMPVLVTPGIGDLDRIVSEEGVGVVLGREGDESLRRAVDDAAALGARPEVQERCRAVAGRLFSVDEGALRYGALYRALLAA
jgi:glycosyltransferase involved in cell wall biosynthesis